jgi:hypothetical protein
MRLVSWSASRTPSVVSSPLVLVGKAPAPELAAKLTARQTIPMLKGRRNKDAKPAQIQQILRGEYLGQPRR